MFEIKYKDAIKEGNVEFLKLHLQKYQVKHVPLSPGAYQES